MPLPSSMGDEAQELSRFFKNIWGETHGFVYLPTLNRETGEWRKVFFEWPLHEPHIIQHVTTASARGLDSYYSPALYKDHSSPTKDNILGVRVLWSEFDGNAPAHWDGPEAGVAVEGASEGPSGAYKGPLPAPSIRVQTSKDGHEHVYWKLDDLVTDTQWIDDKNKAITYSLRSDTSGWDATQILRPPFTLNTKRDLPVTIVEETERSYSQNTFAFLKPPIQLVSEAIESIEIKELPKLDELIAKYRWPDEAYAMFKDSNIPEGHRSDALMRLGYYCCEMGMNDTETYAVLLNADDRWGKYKNRADRKRRLADIINRARAKHPYATIDTTFAALHEEIDGHEVVEVEKGRPLLYTLGEFMEADFKVEWAIEGLLEVGGYGMVAAMPGVGKTQFSIQLACMAALGKPIVGWDIPKQNKMAIMSLEMSPVALKMFLTTIMQEYTTEEREILNENIYILPWGEPIQFTKPEGFQNVISYLDQIKPDGIIIDSISKLTSDELNEKITKEITKGLAAIRRRYGCFAWLIHHNRKASENNKKPTGLADVYGSQYITAEMTSCLVLWYDQKTRQIEVIPVKMRLAELRKPFYIIRNENLHFTLGGDIEENAAMLSNLHSLAEAVTSDNIDGDDGKADLALGV